MKHNFTYKLLEWYAQNRRELPWRKTKNPYKIWLSEIILQQTRVAQGLPYYKAFIKKYPNILALAKAEEQDVLKLWQGLGYYSRARNLHFTAKYIVNELDGKFPATYRDLLKLKGVGDYTASAIASFCYNEITPTLDGNVYRVLARHFGLTTAINTPKAQKEFKAIAYELIDKKNPALFNQAIMEFGALQCVPKNPNCTSCPLQDSCEAFYSNKVQELPKKLKKIKVRKRFFNYLVVLTDDNHTILHKRIGKGIWQNLYEFPLIESAKEINFDSLITHTDFKKIIENQSFSMELSNEKPKIHKLSHQHLYIKFWRLRITTCDKASLTTKEALALPTPIVIHNFMESFFRN